MAVLPKGITSRVDTDTGEIFFDVDLKHRGKTIAKESDFPDLDEALNFYYKHLDKQNISRKKLNSGAVRYIAEYYKGNKCKPLRKTFDTFQEAVKWRRQCREKGAPDSSNAKASMSFIKFSLYWIENEVKVKRSPNTILTYTNNLYKHVFPVLGKMRLDDIKKSDINELVGSLQKKGKSAGTINLILAMVGRCFEYACANEILDKNVMRRYEKVTKQSKQGDYWEEEDISLFLSYTRSTPYFELFYTVIRTGLRKGEVLGLKWDCINFKTEQITVKRNRTQFELREVTKSKKVRMVPMTTDLMDVLKQLKAKNNPKPDSYVFLNKNGTEVCYQTISTLFNEYQRKSGVSKKIRFHDLRHTFASQYSLKGGDIERLQKLLGHSDLKMTQIYSHLNEAYIMNSREFIEKLTPLGEVNDSI